MAPIWIHFQEWTQVLFIDTLCWHMQSFCVTNVSHHRKMFGDSVCNTGVDLLPISFLYHNTWLFLSCILNRTLCVCACAHVCYIVKISGNSLLKFIRELFLSCLQPLPPFFIPCIPSVHLSPLKSVYLPFSYEQWKNQLWYHTLWYLNAFVSHSRMFSKSCLIAAALVKQHFAT
jgi:hypothetical protein